MYNQGTHPTNSQNIPDGILPDELTKSEKQNLSNYSKKLQSEIDKLLPNTYKSETHIQDSQYGIVIGVQIFHHSKNTPVINSAIMISNIVDDDNNSKKSKPTNDNNNGSDTTELSKELVAATVAQLQNERGLSGYNKAM